MRLFTNPGPKSASELLTCNMQCDPFLLADDTEGYSVVMYVFLLTPAVSPTWAVSCSHLLSLQNFICLSWVEVYLGSVPSLLQASAALVDLLISV